MTVYFLPEQPEKSDNEFQCYKSCYSILKTVASLTGISLSFFSVNKVKVSDIEKINPFCRQIFNLPKNSPLYKNCHNFHKSILEEASTTKSLCIKECPYKLKTFILPLKDSKGNILFYVVGGHYLTKKSEPDLDEISQKLGLPVEEIKKLYNESPIIDNKKFHAIIKKLSEISKIYQQELEQEKKNKNISKIVTFISSISKELSGKINLKDLLLSIIQKVCLNFNVEKCIIALLDDTKEFIKIFASNNEYIDKIP